MTVARRILKNTLFLLGSGIIGQGLGFVVTIYLARVLGVKGFGAIAYAMAFATYFYMLGNLGLPLLGTRAIASDRSQLTPVFSTIVILRLVLSCLGFVLLLLIGLLVEHSHQNRQLIVLFGLGVFPAACLLDWMFQGLERMQVISASRIMTALVAVGLIVTLIKSTDQLLWVPGIYVAAAWVGALVLIVLSKPYAGQGGGRMDWRQGVRMLKEALPLGVSMLLVQMLYFIDTVMMGMLHMEAEVGLYNVGFKIVFFIISCGAFYYDAIFPVMCNYYTTSHDALQRLSAQTARLMVGIGLPLGVGGTLLARPLMIMVYGQAYEAAAVGFQILIWFAAIMYLNMIYDRGLWACGRYKTYLAIITAEVVLNIAMNIVLIPRFGMIGAALCKVAVTLLGFVLYYRVFNGIVSVPFGRYLFRPALACLAMATVLWGGLILHWPVLLLMGVGGGVYVAVLWGVRGITSADVQFVRSLLIKR